MTYYAVIDTNVIVSSMLKADSIPGLIINYVESNVIIPLLSEEIIDEYIEVLTRNKFEIAHDKVMEMISIIKSKGIILKREQTLEEFVDKDDIVFFEIVMSARQTMDAYLVTGNMKHYPIRSYVVTPREIIDIIEREKETN